MRSNARWNPPWVVDSQLDWTIRQDAAATAAWARAVFRVERDRLLEQCDRLVGFLLGP